MVGSVVAVAGAVLFAASTSTPVAVAGRSAPALKGHLVFTRAGGRYADETIFVADADGSHQRQLTRAGSSCCPRATRDGKRLLLSASAPGGRITTATMNRDATEYTRLPLPDDTINLGPGAWSPDGTKIAFEGWDDAKPTRGGIYLGRWPDNRDLTRVTKAHGDIPGDFSPDGKRLAFFRQRPGEQSVGSVWVVGVDGKNPRRLTPEKMLAGFGTVRWSPDGSKILFQDARDERQGDLWTVHPDGSHLTRLFADRRGRFAISPTWSPDGSQIMFALDPTAAEFDHPNNAFYVINADGTRLELVIAGRDFKREPDWTR